jgi:hypothetical protein
MAKINGRLIYTIPKWRIAVAKCIIWPIAWAYAFDLLSDANLDKITARLARFVCGDIRKNSRMEWE